MPSSPPVILTIAGSDSCAGAGLQADLKTIAAHGGYGICAVTALVSEIPGKVSKVLTVEADLLADQLHLLSENYPIAAMKTGMLANQELCHVVADFLNEISSKCIPVVVDPVMVATAGDRLLDDDAIDIYRRRIFSLAHVATPNLSEAEALLDRKISDVAEMESAAREFHQRFGCEVIIKGGHLDSNEEAIDVLFDGDALVQQVAPRIAGVNTHGTGCTFSAALATLLGSGRSLSEAFRIAKSYITAAINQSHHWQQPGDIHALNHRPENVA